MVEEMIAGAVDALSRQSTETAHTVIDKDRAVDEQELLVDAMCMRLLETEKPQGAELRFITMAMQIATDLERMADLAVDVAQRSLVVADQPVVRPLIEIGKMAFIARRMLRDVLQAFVGRDASLARRIYLDENEQDRLRDEVYRDLVNSMQADASLVPLAIPYLLISRHLERICDHATNIAEDIIYIVDGQVARHHPWMVQPQQP